MGSRHGNYTGQAQPARQSVLISPNGARTPKGARVLGVGTLAAGLFGFGLAYGINYINEDTENKTFGSTEVANEHTAGVDGGKITLQDGARIRANPVTNDGNTICMVGVDGPVDIKTKTKKVTLADGVLTNPNDPNGPWVMVDLNNLPDSLKNSCADGVKRDQDGKGWVSVNGGKVNVHLK